MQLSYYPSNLIKHIKLTVARLHPQCRTHAKSNPTGWRLYTSRLIRHAVINGTVTHLQSSYIPTWRRGGRIPSPRHRRGDLRKARVIISPAVDNDADGRVGHGRIICSKIGRICGQGAGELCSCREGSADRLICGDECSRGTDVVDCDIVPIRCPFSFVCDGRLSARARLCG